MHMDCLASFLSLAVVHEATVFSPLPAGMFLLPMQLKSNLVFSSYSFKFSQSMVCLVLQQNAGLDIKYGNNEIEIK